MTYIDLILDLHAGSNRQGPGSESDTLKALSFMNLPPDQTLAIADIGSGNGGQTITLAQQCDAQITAVDLFPAFLNELKDKAMKSGVAQQITTLEKSMEDLPFALQSLDVIWSEGAIYNMGFEKGITNWQQYLKKGGYMALSEITWLTNERPAEINDFWNKAYPEIATASEKVAVIEKLGFKLCGYFPLSEESWIDHYYQPMESRFDAFLKRHNHSDDAQAMVKENQDEIALYQKFKEYYSYGFYIIQKL